MLRRKPTLSLTSRLFRLLNVNTALYASYLRSFSSLGQVENQQNKDDIESWVKNSLHEPMPPQHFNGPIKTTTSHQTTVPKLFIVSGSQMTFMSEKEYLSCWHSRFFRGDLDVVKSVIAMVHVSQKLFSMRQLMNLINSLKEMKRNYEIHEIYCTYQDYIALLNEYDHNDILYHEFLETILLAEEFLKNYQVCEKLFSEYIKYPNVRQRILCIGLKSFIENNNLQLAKEFFLQAMNNPETFPITAVEFHYFLHTIKKYNDFDSMKYFFNIWLTKKCDGKESSRIYYPNYKTLSIFHETYMSFNDEAGLKEFLSNDIVKKTGYESDLLFRLNDFCQNLHKNPLTTSATQADIVEKIDYFLLLLKDKTPERRQFFLSLLKAFVSIDDFKNLKYTMNRIQDDKDIHLSGKFHLVIARYFVNHGLLKHLVGYYSDIVRKQSMGRIRLRIGHIQQLWDCALQNYPILTKEITNEMKITLNKDEYIREFPHIKQLIKETSQVSRRKVMGGDEFLKSELSRLDLERLHTFEQRIATGYFDTAEPSILENMRQGIKPQFNFYLCALRKCLNSSLPTAAKMLDDLFLKSYHKVPLKVSILWLRYDILSKYKSSASKPEPLGLSTYQLIEFQINEFVRSNEESLSFQNCLQLSQLSIYVRAYQPALALLEQARIRIEEQNKHQWLMYYMTALKASARVYNPVKFLSLLKEWNSNPNAKWVTRGCIRQVKAFTKLYHKKRESVVNYDEEVIQSISQEVDCLVERYISFKFEGLNDVNEMCSFLKRWLNQEMKEISKHEKKRRKTKASTNDEPIT